MLLKPDAEEKINGLQVYEYNLLRHNEKSIPMPTLPRRKTNSITVHFLQNFQVPINTSPAEYCVRAILNKQMDNTRVHYFIDNECAWRCLPESWTSWSCGDGLENEFSGNNVSLSIVIIGKAYENAVKLLTALLKKYNFTSANLKINSDWNSCNCPAYIQSDWLKLKNAIAAALGEIKEEPKPQITNEKPKEESKPQDDTVITYRVYVDGKWLEETTSTNKEPIGRINWPIKGLAAKSSKGNFTYRVHLQNGGWLNWISDYNIIDWHKGCAGFRTQLIDAIQLSLEGTPSDIYYKIFTTSGNETDWVQGTSAYAGIFGQPIDRILIEVR